MRRSGMPGPKGGLGAAATSTHPAPDMGSAGNGVTEKFRIKLPCASAPWPLHSEPVGGKQSDLAQPAPEPAKRSPAHYLWAVLIARIYEVFPLTCPICAGQMRIIAFITDGAEVRKILARIGADSQAPRITPARGPPLWEDCGAPVGEGVEVEPDWDISAQIALADQRISW